MNVVPSAATMDIGDKNYIIIKCGDEIMINSNLKMIHKKIFILLLMVLPVAAFATKPAQCSLNSTCSFDLRGRFNLKIKTTDLKAGVTYQCQMNRKSVGRLLSIRNIDASSGVRYSLKGDRFDKPFIIHGPKKGVGHI